MVRENDAVTELIPVAAAIAGLNVYALALILLRAPVFGTKVYRPMVWNIWLSVLPALVLVGTLAALFAAVAFASAALMWLAIIVGGLIWLLMLPNAAYLITELNFSHRREKEPVPLWYDIALVLTLALSGVANTLLNVLLAQTIVIAIAYPNSAAPMAEPASWVLVASVLVLVAFGIYLGRYLRFNSWDLKNPMRFVRKLTDHFADRSRRIEALGFTAVHTILLAILYLLVAGPAIAALM